MRLIIFLCLFFLVFPSFSQKKYVEYFDVIISLSASNTDSRVAQIKILVASDTSGLVYEGYCKSQKCIILKATNLIFSSSDSVFNYLKLHIGDAVLAYKDYTVKEFYKQCTFASEEEYQYFKKTYQ